MYLNSWDVMRTGATDQALRQLKEDFAEEPNASCIMELGVAYLWLGNYRSAWEHFYDVTLQFPNSISIFYSMAGVAKWCLSEPEEAVKQWRDGLRADFADAAGGVKLPLMLFYASIVRPEVFPRAEAEEILIKRANDPRVRVWPGPLAEFVLGRIDETRLREQCLDKRFDDETMLHHWSADFFVAVLEHDRGNIAQSRESMQKTGTTSWQEFDQYRRLFLGKLWSEEFFLARHEIARTAAQSSDSAR